MRREADCWEVRPWNGCLDMTKYSLPLLTDHHSHPLLYSAFRQSLDLSEVQTWEEAADKISNTPSNGLVVGYGWKDNRFDFPTDAIDRLPAFAVFNLSLHRLLVNASGREFLFAKFGQESTKLDDHDWYESHLRVVWNWFALLNGSAAALEDFYKYLESIGVGSAEEMLLVDEQEIEFFRQAKLLDRTQFWAAPDTYEQLSSAARKSVTGIKLFTDGAFGARTAAVEQPYEDDSDNRGLLLYTDQELGQTLEKSSRLAAPGQLGLAVHAIGDRAIEQLLTQLEASGEIRRRFRVIRIEHAQLISLTQARQAKKMGIILSMQPNFTVDSLDYADRLGPDRTQRNNPFRMLIDQVGFEPGVDLIFGSDGMPHGPEYALRYSLFPPTPMQKLSLEEFEAGYCRDRSFARFEIEINEP